MLIRVVAWAMLLRTLGLLNTGLQELGLVDEPLWRRGSGDICRPRKRPLPSTPRPSWPTAVAQYHSRDEDRGAYYQKKVYDLWYGQRDNLVASAAEDVPVIHSAVLRQRMTEQEAMLEQRAKKAELQRIRAAARAANAAFLQRQAASPRPGTRPRSKPARQRPWQHSRK